MVHRVAPKVAAIVFALAVVVSPIAALPALATPSIPIPPPATGPHSLGTSKTVPAEVIVMDAGSLKMSLTQIGNGTIQYPLSEEYGDR